MSSIHRAGEMIFFAGAMLIAFSLPLWNLGMSLGQFVMAGGWLLAGNLRERLRRAVHQPVFWLLLALFFIHVTGLWNTADMKYAMKDIRVKLPLLLMPLLFAAGPLLTVRQLRIILFSLLAGVLISTLSGFAAYQQVFGMTVSNYRDLSLFISHIRLSLLIDVSIVVAVYFSVTSASLPVKVLMAGFILWCCYFLLLLQSITGMLLLGALLGGGLVYAFLTAPRLYLRVISAVFFLTMGYAGWKLYDFVFIQSIREVEINTSELKAFTARGNAYKNDWSRKDMENGRYVWLQYNDLEMDTAWMKQSKQRVWDNDARGNMQLVTLMRYLTYMGYSKDAEGVNKLSDNDVKMIEAGWPTPEQEARRSSVIYRIEELADEYRNYYFNNYSSGHTLAQRLEYWKTAVWILSKNPLSGVGTGDVPDAFQQAYIERNSSLEHRWRLRAHNQYLSLAVAFGWPGLLLFVTILFITLRLAIQRRDLLFLAFLIIAIGSFFNEDTLETQAGVTFYAFLNGMLLFRRHPEEDGVKIYVGSKAQR